MGIDIFYFSGTGNSLAAAKDIAGKINGKLTAIVSVIDIDKIKIDSEIIGIVFPVYNQGLPLIVKRFIEKVDSFSDKYIFGICTCGNSPGLCLKYLNNLIKERGGRLSAGFAVKMPYNYVSPSLVFRNFYGSFKLKETSPEKQLQLFDQWKSRLDYVSEYITSRKKGHIETKAKVIEYIVDSLNLRETAQKSSWLKIGGFHGRTVLSFIESVRLMDHAFYSDDSCVICGICSKICPSSNIKFENGSPKWQHKCYQCFACLNWCPKHAIQFSSKTPGQKRYHHPDINLSDMIPK